MRQGAPTTTACLEQQVQTPAASWNTETTKRCCHIKKKTQKSPNVTSSNTA